MSMRPGYEDLVAERGREVADKIIESAEFYSDAAHKDWDEALAWAIAQHDAPPDAALEAQQARNVQLFEDLQQRRGDGARAILYLLNKMPGDAFNYPDRQAAAELAWLADPLPDGFSVGEGLEWAKRHAEG